MSCLGEAPRTDGYAQARPSDMLILRVDPLSELWRHQRRLHCWLPVDKPVPIHHILSAAQRTGYSVGEVACRLSELGYQVPSAARTVGAVESEDHLLVSRALNGQNPWLDECDKRATPIPVDVGHVVAAASQLGRPIGQVTERLATLGFLVPDMLAGGIAESADRIILSENLNGRYPWLQPKDETGQPAVVPDGHVLSAAAQLGRDVSRVATRLADLGFTVPKHLLGRGRIDVETCALIRRDPTASATQPGAVTIPIGHVLLTAERLRLSVDQLTQRLTSIGFELPSKIGMARHEDLVIVSWNLDGEPPWVPMAGWIWSEHVVEAAAKTGRPVGSVARRLSDLGFNVAGDLLNAGDLQHGDHLMITDDLTEEGGTLPQWDENDVLIPVPVGHAVAVAQKLGCSIGQAARRLAQLGYLVPTAYFDLGPPQAGDCVLTSRDLTGEWPWLTDPVVPLGHLATAAERLGRRPDETAERLKTLGFTVPDRPSGRGLDTTDLILISRELAVLPPPEVLLNRRFSDCGWWLDQQAPVPLWNVVAGAAQTNLSIPQVVDRLRSLNLEVPDIPDLLEIPPFSPRSIPGSVTH